MLLSLGVRKIFKISLNSFKNFLMITELLTQWYIIFTRSLINLKKMITDSQIFTALMVALVAAILAIGLGRQLYV